MPESVQNAIETNAAGPKKVVIDGQAVEQHDISEQIAADRYLSAKTAASTKLGIRRCRVVPPGTV